MVSSEQALMTGAVLLGLVVVGAAHAREARAMGIKRSDVVFMGARSPEIYQEYGTTVVSWGGRPWSASDAAFEQYRRRVEAAHKLGIRYLPGAAFRTAFAGMIDFAPEDFMDSVCRTLDGGPITVPWLWDHKHKGQPAYWFCTNAPRYRQYLKRQMRRAFEIDVEGLHIDDYAGTAGTHWAGGGCFCPHCMAAFRAYLRQNVPPQELTEAGVASLDGFDYGEFLRARGIDAEQFRKYAGWYPERIPLSHRFLEFQLRASTAWVAEYRKWAEQLEGHPLMLCVNSGVSSPENLMIAPVVTFFSGEVRHDAEKGEVSFSPVWSFKLGDALGRPVACTAMGWDWAFVNANNKPGLVRTWIAQAYAFGHQFMPPVRQWCYTKEKGTHWWEPPPEEFAYLYRFIRQHADLFDGYDAVARVGLLYSNAALRRHRRGAQQACLELAELNVPFRLLMAGDDWLDERLEPDDLAGLKAIVVTEPAFLDAKQQAVLDAAKDKVVTWPDRDRLFELAPPPLRLEGAEKVTLVPRARSDRPDGPFICHLVNRNYSLDADAVAPQKNFSLLVSDELFGRAIRTATLYAPRREPVGLTVGRQGDVARITIPELELWAVVALQ